ncbi:MAG: HlyD family efflux transporter periplasmic adaptor subunit [Planctomycetota bacterium]
MKRLLLVLPLVAVALAALIWSQHRPGEFFVSGFVESHQIRLGSRVGGRVAQVRVAEGQQVPAGAALFDLEPYDLNERAAQAQATLAASQAVLEKLRAGARQEELAQARASRDRAKVVLDKLLAGARPQEIKAQEARVAKAEAELRAAQREFDRLAALEKEGRAAEQEITAVTRALEVARAVVDFEREEWALLREGPRAEEISEQRARLAEAEAALALLEAGTRAEDIAHAEANVTEARAAVAAIERQLAELTVTAPVAGVVEAAELRPGDLVAPNAPVVALDDPAELWVRAYVPENRLNLSVGQKVTVRVDSFPGRTFAGHISFIAREAEFTPANVQTPEERSKQVFRIKVLLDEGLDVLRPGMAADVHFGAAR